MAVLKPEEMKTGPEILLGADKGKPACGVMVDPRLLVRAKALVRPGTYKRKSKETAFR